MASGHVSAGSGVAEGSGAQGPAGGRRGRGWRGIERLEGLDRIDSRLEDSDGLVLVVSGVASVLKKAIARP